MVIALVSPDGLSTVLFCSGIIRALASIPGSRILVITDEETYRDDIKALGAETIHVPMARFVDPLADLKYFTTLYRIFRRERCEVVFTLTTKPNIYGPIAARLAGVKRVISNILGLGMNFLPQRKLSSRIVQRIVHRLYGLANSRADRLWFTNVNDLQIMLDRGIVTQDKALVTPFWVDVDTYTPDSLTPVDVEAARAEVGLAPGERMVIMIARLIWPKGIREFVDAAEMLRIRHPDVKFLLVAPPQEGAADEVPVSWVREKERSVDNFKWLDFQKDIKRLYAIADLAVLPSFYKEGGYPRALQEPMAMGKPVITTDSPDCRATVEEGRNGYLVPMRDSRALAEAISRLMSNPEKCVEFGHFSRLKVEREFNEREIVGAALLKLGLPVRQNLTLEPEIDAS